MNSKFELLIIINYYIYHSFKRVILIVKYKDNIYNIKIQYTQRILHNKLELTNTSISQNSG